MMKSYSELILLPTFKERFEYLKLCDGKIGAETFGGSRYLNQVFYNSDEWKNLRHRVIVRDNGCDLGMDGYDILGKAIIHHINPVTKEQLLNRDPVIFSMENLITTTFETHNAIHYGDVNSLTSRDVIERSVNDTCPWRRDI